MEWADNVPTGHMNRCRRGRYSRALVSRPISWNRSLLTFVAVACLLAIQAQATQAPTPKTVLIRNVRLIDRGGAAGDVVVSLLIQKGKLDVVTKDRISRDKADLALDAEDGVLLGKLDVGQPPSFLILDADPREDLRALLDTKTHARFAMQLGEIVKNDLPAIGDPDPEEEEKQRGWLAYTPPPLALPLSYQDSTKWNRWDTKYVSGIFVSAMVLDRQRWLSQDDASREQVKRLGVESGELTEFDGGEIRGFRFGAIGTFNFSRPWVYTFFAATNAFDKGFDTDETDDITLFDYRLDIPLWQRGTLSLGKQKEPISMERLMGGVFLMMQERTSVSDSMMPSRNVGVVLNGTIPSERVTFAGGVFNNWFDAREKLDESATQIVGRVTGLPFVSKGGGSLLHLGFGVRHTDAKQGLQFRTEPEFNLAPDFVDTGHFEADSATTYDFEVSAIRGPLWLSSEFVRTDVRSSSAGDPSFSGYHLTAAWTLSGEARSYSRRGGVVHRYPIAKPVTHGGWGGWELGARYSHLDLTDGAIEGGEMDIVTLGFNWWLTPVFLVNANYKRITLDRFGVEGTSTGILARVVLMLE